MRRAGGFNGNELATNETDEAVRVKAVYAPTDWLKLTGSLEQTSSKSFEADALRLTSYNGAGYTIGGITPQQEPVVSYTIYNNSPDYSDTNQDAATLREEIALGWGEPRGYHELSRSEDDHSSRHRWDSRVHHQHHWLAQKQSVVAGVPTSLFREECHQVDWRVVLLQRKGGIRA